MYSWVVMALLAGVVVHVKNSTKKMAWAIPKSVAKEQAIFVVLSGIRESEVAFAVDFYETSSSQGLSIDVIVPQSTIFWQEF